MKVSFFFLFIILMLTLTSCGDSINYEDITYYQGSDGVTMDFTDNSPPEKVYAEQIFPVSVLLHNMGTTELQLPLYASVSVIYDGLYFTETEESLRFLVDAREKLFLSGKSAYWPMGEDRMVTLALLKANSLPARTGADSPIIVSLCYPYRTLLATQVCVDSQTNDLREQICYAEDQSFSDQGAPIAFTDIEYDSMPVGTVAKTVVSNRPVTDNQGYIVGTTLDETTEYVTTVRPLLKIHLENVGGGQLVRAREFGEQLLCGSQDGTHPANSVMVRGWLGGGELDCVPNPIHFIDGGADISCTLPLENLFAVQTNFYSTLQLEAAYVYQERQNVDVEIDDSSKQFNPPDVLVAKCSDFNRNYDLCRSYAQRGELISDSLDCYYCSDSGLCLSGASSCSQCGSSTQSDDATKRCVESCGNQPPTMRTFTINERKTVSIVCEDPSGVDTIDHHICGCKEFRYTWADSADKCPQTVNSYSSKTLGNWESQRRITTATIPIPSERQTKDSVLCVMAVSNGGVSSSAKTYDIKLQT